MRSPPTATFSGVCAAAPALLSAASSSSGPPMAAQPRSRPRCAAAAAAPSASSSSSPSCGSPPTPHDLAYPARAWATLLGLPDPAGRGARRINEAILWLEQR